MANTPSSTEIINTGLQRKKSKKEIMEKLIEYNQYTDASRTYLNNIDEDGMFGGGVNAGKPIADTTTSGDAQVTSATAAGLGDSKAAKEMLNSLEGSINSRAGENAFAPIEGRLRALNPYDTETQSIQSQINATKQIVGKYLEGGVLRAEDEKKYEKILPKIGDTKEVAQNKLKQVQQLIEEKYNAQIETMGASGFDVENLIEKPEKSATPNVEEVKSKLKKQYEYATTHPEDERSARFLDAWKNNKIDLTTGKLKEELQPKSEFDLEFEKRMQEQGLKKDDNGGTENKEENDGVFGAVKQGFSNIGQSIKNSGEGLNDVMESDTNKLTKTAGVLGKLLKPFSTILGEAVLTPARMAGEGVENLTGKNVNKATEELVGKAVEAGMDTKVAQKAMETYSKMDDEGKVAVNALLDIAEFATIGKGGQVLGKAKKPVANAVKSTGSKIADTAGKLKPATREAKDYNKVYGELESISKSKANLRNFKEESRKRGVDVNDELAKTDVLQNSVDDNGTITTKGEGGAIEKYTKRNIEGLDKKVSEGLKAEGRSVGIEDVRKSVISKLDTDENMIGSVRENAINTLNKELDALEKQIGKDIPLDRLNNLKIALQNTINYSNPDVAVPSKAITRGIKEFIEESSESVDVKNINQELTKHYTVRDYLEKLDGSKVEGGRLGKYAAGALGMGVGAIAGGATGGMGAALIGLPVGAWASSKLKGVLMKKALNKKIIQKLDNDENLTSGEMKSVSKELDAMAKSGEIKHNPLRKAYEIVKSGKNTADVKVDATTKKLIDIIAKGTKGKGGLSIKNVTQGAEYQQLLFQYKQSEKLWNEAKPGSIVRKNHEKNMESLKQQMDEMAKR